MADYIVMKAVEHGKLPSKFRKQYPDLKSLQDAGWWLQKKYDGCMGIADVWNHNLGNSRMLSRTGEDYTLSCGHILNELHEAMDDRHGPNDWEHAAFIGEVWQPIEEAAFPTISGKFRRQNPSPELRFVVNDILPAGYTTTSPYRLRYQDVVDLLGLPGEDFYKVTTAETWKNPSHFWEDPLTPALQWQGQGGFDGAILRDPNAGYTVGTVKAGEIVKVKPTLSLDLVVEDLVVQKGEKTGRNVYTLYVLYNGVRSSVGSGMPHMADECPYPGDIVEIECLGITADGKLREPRFKGIRHDKLKPD